MPAADTTMHERYMALALDEARKSMATGNRPVGSVIVRHGEVVAHAGNTMFTDHDPSAHAEIAVLRDACRRFGAVELPGATLYTTLEPCPMCCWALLEAKVERLVMGGRYASIGGFDLGRYTVESFLDFTGRKLEIVTGVLQAQCEAMRIEWINARQGR